MRRGAAIILHKNVYSDVDYVVFAQLYAKKTVTFSTVVVFAEIFAHALEIYNIVCYNIINNE